MSPQDDRVAGTDEDPEVEAMEDAAEALREADMEAAQPGIVANDAAQLEDLSIDDLRKLAAELDVPNRERILEQDKLIRAIRRCL
jgi:hypothetical protein